GRSRVDALELGGRALPASRRIARNARRRVAGERRDRQHEEGAYRYRAYAITHARRSRKRHASEPALADGADVVGERLDIGVGDRLCSLRHRAIEIATRPR